ncbi:MAG: biotin--[Fibrobacter sp.]|uniref:biotin--[acetyl-CoA-carboxylase] ligase n=1 Tax=Fibrobacter sp. TaxID=35828 RepID=UPI0025C114C0|nr:biotin--[acetyl-CoA-carboxylase] ligase [Fibrobacter sp.]MBQ9226483.1 biotin--[acetyl-CoA-carboxylase] ligase [Fibrobacter sp.]
MFSRERNFNEWHLCGFGDAPAFLFASLESTHSLMKARASAGEIVPGTLIVADTQTAGRGRHERTWASPAGKNLYFNILIPLEGIPLASAPQITQVASLTFAEVFRDLQESSNAQGLGNTAIGKVTVKWPNDILCGKSKFCGILAELVYIKRTVIPAKAGISTNIPPAPAISMGVGINVNSDPADYAHLGRAVTTLRDICGQSVNREKLLQSLIASLERAIGQFRAFGIRPWVAAWKKMDQFIGARGTIVVNNRCTDDNRDGGNGVQKKAGRIADMRDDGSLLFECDDGTTETVYSADLEI